MPLAATHEQDIAEFRRCYGTESRSSIFYCLFQQSQISPTIVIAIQVLSIIYMIVVAIVMFLARHTLPVGLHWAIFGILIVSILLNVTMLVLMSLAVHTAHSYREATEQMNRPGVRGYLFWYAVSSVLGVLQSTLTLAGVVEDDAHKVLYITLKAAFLLLSLMFAYLAGRSYVLVHREHARMSKRSLPDDTGYQPSVQSHQATHGTEYSVSF